MTSARRRPPQALWILGLVMRHQLRQRAFWFLVAGFAALSAWWLLAVPQPDGVDLAVRGWPRWLAYAWLAVRLAAAPGRSRHALLLGVRPRPWSWSGSRLTVEAGIALLAGELLLVFHVKLDGLGIDVLLTAAAVAASLAACIWTGHPKLRTGLTVGFIAAGELVVQRDPSTAVAGGVALVALSVLVLLDLHWRRSCVLQS